MSGLTGWLWVDDRPDVALADKILNGAHYYACNRGQRKIVAVHVHPNLAGVGQVGDIKVIADLDFQPNFFWYSFAEGAV